LLKAPGLNEQQSQADHPHGALPQIPGGWVQRDVTVSDRVFQITVPHDPDAFLDDETVLARSRSEDYMPYWPYLWPAAVDMARVVFQQAWPQGQRALEIGSGIGLVGLAAASQGLRVTFSDYDSTAVQLAHHNAVTNGFTDSDSILLDWRTPDVSPFPIILGCDVLYETKDHPMILEFLMTVLEPDGVCWLGDPGRQHAPAFCDLARGADFSIEVLNGQGQPIVQQSARGLFRVGEFRMMVLRRGNVSIAEV
jgi:predicted nicotinamide N-methyase